MPGVHAAVQSAAGLPVNVAATSSPQTVTHDGAGAAHLIISGGTVSAIAYSRDNVTFFTTGLTSGIFPIGPGDSIKVTYSVAPTMTLVPF